MTRLAFHCVEMGMSNEEIYVILEDADNRWKKFTHRTDRETRLLGIISYVRTEKAVRLDIIDQCPVYRFKDFMNTDIELDWIIEGILPVAGSGVIYGPGGIGKSTFMLRMAIALALGKKEFLSWKITRRIRVIFQSLEMGHDEVKEFFRDMKLTEQEIEELQEWLFIWPIGHDYPLDVRDQQIEVLKYLDLFEPGLLIVDSLGAATYGSVKDVDDMKRLYSFVNEDIRQKRKCGVFFIHHPTKGAESTEMYGDTYIYNRSQSVIMLQLKGLNTIEVTTDKARLSLDKKTFKITRTPNRDYIPALKSPSAQEKLDKLISENPGILSIGRVNES